MDRIEGLLSSKKREYALLILFFFIIAIVFTWPLIMHLHNGIIGSYNDTLLNDWIISWDARTIFTSPTHLFQGNIIYPSRDVLAYSEHLFILGVLAAPIYYASGNPILANNFLVFFGLVLSAFGCYLLVKELTGSRWGSLVGALFFAFCPYKIAKIGHLHILFSPFLPFMLLYLYRYLDKGGRKNLILFGLFFLAQSLASWHYLVFCSMAAGLLLLWTAIFSRKKEEWLRLGGAVMFILLAVVIMLPFALPYLRANSRLPGFERSLEEAGYYSAIPEDYLRVLPESLVYGDAPSPFQEFISRPEGLLYPGVVVIFLALAGLFMRRREGDDAPVFDKISFRKGALYFLILTIVGIILTFGPEIGGVSNPLYHALYYLGILKFIRFPTRFFVLISLGLAVLAGYGAAKIAARVAKWKKSWRAGQLTAAALVLLLLVEIATFNLTVLPVPVWGEVPEVYPWLSGQGDVRVIELPTSPLGEGAGRYDDWRMGFVPEDAEEYTSREGMLMYLSTYHWKKISNGYSGYLPFFYRRIFTEMQAFPSPRSIGLLRGLGIDYIVWHRDWVQEGEREKYEERLLSSPGLALEEDFGEEVVFRVVPGSMATSEDLEVSAVSPWSVPAGEGFNLGLITRNAGESPFVSVEENPQRFRLRFLDASGGVAHVEEGEYRAPFFLEPGEETSLPLKVEEVPPEGPYRMELALEGGVLPEQIFSLHLEVFEPQDLIGSAILSGTVTLKEAADTVNIPAPDGLYTLVLEVENTGDSLWRSEWEKEQVGGHYPFGLVFLCVRWVQEGELAWEEQSGVLPCDISPGQSVEAPILVRPPPEPGSYQLVAGLRDKDVDWFGGILIVDVTLK